MSQFKLILFDVDGTLLNSGGSGTSGMRQSMIEVFGTAGRIDDHPLGGKTDPQIIRELMLQEGFPPDEIQARLPVFCKTYIEILKRSISSFHLTALPGVNELLAALSDRNEPVLGLLTGNLEEIVKPKLKAAGIPPEAFVLGAYGSDDADRNRLPAVAISRAEALLHQPVQPESVLIIGDTPNDIRCARAGKTQAMAVATGHFSVEDLSEHHPDFLLADLSDTSAILRILTT